MINDIIDNKINSVDFLKGVLTFTKYLFANLN